MALLQSDYNNARDLRDPKMVVYEAVDKIRVVKDYGKVLFMVSLGMLIVLTVSYLYVDNFPKNAYAIVISPFILSLILSVIMILHERYMWCQQRKMFCDIMIYTMVYSFLMSIVIVGLLLIKQAMAALGFSLFVLLAGTIVIIVYIKGRRHKEKYSKVTNQTEQIVEIKSSDFSIEE
jgi:hypothetical protein